MRDTTIIERKEIAQIFRTVDLDRSCHITAFELRHFVAGLHIHLPEDERAELVKIYDLDGDRQLTITAFEIIIERHGLTLKGEAADEIGSEMPPASGDRQIPVRST